jgi:ribonuclease D
MGFQVYLNKLDEFINDIKNYNGKFVSIDFEYTKHNIQLWQVCFYNKDNNNKIYVTDIKLVDENNMNLIINKLLTSQKIIKIFHGAESLDFPYLLKVLKEPKLIYKFLNSTYDTRFLCEYYGKITKSDNKLCNVYAAMLYFGTISKNKYDELQKLNKDIGPIWKVNWANIGSDEKLLKYTIYDVIYLKHMFIRIYNLFKKENLKDDFFDLQKVNTYVILKRNNINYNFDLKLINDKNKYKIIDYYRALL